MQEHERPYAKKFVAWVKKHHFLWRHLHLRCVAIRAGEAWTVLWLRADLAGNLSAAVVQVPVLNHPDVFVIDKVLSIGCLPVLLRAIVRGRIDDGSLPGLPTIRLAWPPKQVPDIDSPDDKISPATHDRPFSSWWSRLEVTARPGSPADWAREDSQKTEYVRGIDQRFETLGQGRLNAVGIKLGLLAPGTAQFTETMPGTIRLVAPLPARIHSIAHDRETDGLLVTTDVATTYPKGRLSVRLIEPTGRQRRAKTLPIGRRVVRFNRPVPGEAQIILSDAEHGVIGRREGRIHPPLRLRPRTKAVSLVDPDFERIRADLRSTKANEHERAVALVVHLLGFSPAWWGRGMQLPKGHQTGINAVDIVAMSDDNRTILVIECSTDWLGDDTKFAKLVGRTNNLRRTLQMGAGSEGPSVQPFVAIGKDRVDAPPALIQVLARNVVGLLAADDLEDMLLMSAKGLSDAELTGRFRGCLPPEENWPVKITSAWRPPIEDW